MAFPMAGLMVLPKDLPMARSMALQTAGLMALLNPMVVPKACSTVMPTALPMARLMVQQSDRSTDLRTAR
jgi:hypothetical protein